jgi:hypothetical protein
VPAPAFLCGIVLAGRLCFGDPNGLEIKASMEDSWPVSSSDLSGEGWSATVIWWTDHEESLNPTRLSRACFEGRCVGYFRTCDTADRCRFVFDRGNEQALVLEIEARSPVGMTRALGSIAYLPAKDDIASRMPLTAFDEQSRFVSPFCGRRRGPDRAIIWDAGCEFLKD